MGLKRRYSFLYICFCFLTCDGLFVQDHFHLFHGIHLEDQLHWKFSSCSLMTCSTECLTSSECTSFSYDSMEQMCHLNDNNTDVANVTTGDRFIYGSKLPGCGEPPYVKGASSQYLGDFVSAQTIYTCNEDYITCHSNNTSVCKSTWQNVSDLCGRFRWINPEITPKFLIPCGSSDRFNVTIIGKVVSLAHPASICVGRWYDSLLQMYFNVVTNQTQLTYELDGIAGPNTTIPYVPFTLGSTFQLDLSLANDVFTVIVDGEFFVNVSNPKPNPYPRKVTVDNSILSLALLEFHNTI